MTKHIMFLALAAAVVLGGAQVLANGSNQESMMGSVKHVSGSTISVERGATTFVFSIDEKTHVAARGATSKTRANIEAGKAGLTLPDVVRVGDQVLIRYELKEGVKTAADIQVRARASDR